MMQKLPQGFRSQSLWGARNSAVGGEAQNTTRYFLPLGYHASNATETNRELIVLRPMLITKLMVYVSQNNVDNSTTVTLRQNGANTSLSVTYAAGETGFKSVTGKVLYDDEDTISVQFAIGAGGVTDTLTPDSWSVLYWM